MSGARRQGLGVLRLIFANVAIAMLLLLFVLSVTLPWTTDAEVPTVAWALLLVGPVGVAGALWARRRPLPCDESLGQAYARRMFIGIGFGESPALAAFVAAFLADAAWLYLVGLGLSAVALSLVAPLERDLDHQEALLRARGCHHSLRAALGVGQTTTG